MTQTGNLRLSCLLLAIHQCHNSRNTTDYVISTAKKFCDFVSGSVSQTTSDPETKYDDTCDADTPSETVSRQWLYERLMEMLKETESRRNGEATFSGTYYLLDGKSYGIQEVIDLINPKKQ